MIACLSAYTRLKEPSIEFESPPPIKKHPAVTIPSALSALTYLKFQGVSEYLKDLVARSMPLNSTSYVYISSINTLSTRHNLSSSSVPLLGSRHPFHHAWTFMTSCLGSY